MRQTSNIEPSSEIEETPDVEIYEQSVEDSETPESEIDLDSEEKFDVYKEGRLEDIQSETDAAISEPEAQLEAATSVGLPEHEIESLKIEQGVDTDLEQNEQDIRKLGADYRHKLGDIDFGAAATESREGDVEKEKIMDKSQKEREGIVRRVLTSSLVSGAADFVPFAGGIKMTIEGAAGETLDGEKMKGKSRLIHTAVGVGSFALDFTGVGELAKAGVLGGKSVLVLEKLGAKFATKLPRASRIFSKTAQFMARHPELTAQAEKWVDKKIRKKATKIIKDINNYRGPSAPQEARA